MSYRFIEVASREQVTTITLARPQAFNAITPAMHLELHAAFDAFAADPAQRICVVTGAGERAFCAGSDLKELDPRGTYPPSGYGGLADRHDLNKPVIAAVNGLALGGGFEIALACDIIIASDTACFGLVEPKVGAIALAGGITRLMRQIGPKVAMGLLMTGDLIDADEAKALGLVNEVVPGAELPDAARRWCDRILACAPLAIEATKEVAWRSLDEPGLPAALTRQRDYPAYGRWLKSEDLTEGIGAFVEKRKPNWQGR